MVHRKHHTAGMVIASPQGGWWSLFLRLFFGRQFHDEAVQFLGQAFLVIVGLLSRNVDGLQSRTTVECFFAYFLDACRKLHGFQSGAVLKSIVNDYIGSPLDNHRLQMAAILKA